MVLKLNRALVRQMVFLKHFWQIIKLAGKSASILRFLQFLSVFHQDSLSLLLFRTSIYDHRYYKEKSRNNGRFLRSYRVSDRFFGFPSRLQLCKLFCNAIVSIPELFLFRANFPTSQLLVPSYFSRVTDCPVRSVFIVLHRPQCRDTSGT